MNARSTAPMVAAVHDLSCIGRCALTVVIPTLAALGSQPCPLPTAVLSTHTGGYHNMAVRDLTDFMAQCLDHWQALNLRFDAVYSGYLASAVQADAVMRLIHWQRPAGALIVVDPVMGDEGELYASMPADMPAAMARLCREADLITPNLTEAALLTGRRYCDRPRSPAALCELLDALPGRSAVITSAPMEGGRWANACRDGRDYYLCPFDPAPAHYPGTGDLFASVVTGRMLAGERLPQAMDAATRFVRRAVLCSIALGGDVREGVQLERALQYVDDPPGESTLIAL
ncbi:MAG: pyridoxamine kinase [Clostridiales bacterium]|nr:pyridoxamine kinase [Clostridiales bacterium]